MHFDCQDERLAKRFEFLAAEPEMPHLPETIHSIGTTQVQESFYDFKPPHHGSPGSCYHLLSRGHRILRDLMITEAASCPIIHGASIVASGKRLLLMADKRVGKTTLSLKCLAHGLAVEGDEHVVVRSNDVMARPRTLRVKESSIAVVPEMARQIQDCPYITDWNGDLIYSVAPRIAEHKWSISPGKADVLVFLTANHGGLTSIRLLSVNDAFARLAQTTYLPENGRGAALARLRALVSGAQRMEMRLGCPETAVWHLRQLSTV